MAVFDQAAFIRKWEGIRVRLNIEPETFQVCDLHVRSLLCCSVIHTVETQKIRRRIETDLHTKAIKLRDAPKPPNEASWQACTDRQNPFYKELTEFFLKTDIPIDKLNDPAFDLTEIHNNYSIIAEAIQKLETQGLPLHKSCKIVRRTIRHLLLNVNVRQDVRLKAANVIQDNTDFYEILTTADQCMQKNDYRPQNLPYRWTEQDVRRMKYAPITSVDVERNS
ncbi:hypothetical protein KQX54_007544 [Cotesia glomerata]|uniref:Uncharacterized protein n=1 Tax=Cotesia glomerata TaxID=32391 RepID=A0AAV7HW56_COTGL|nr:hypothetical protein KQX54_007544 [Cotesia glomerata]